MRQRTWKNHAGLLLAIMIAGITVLGCISMGRSWNSQGTSTAATVPQPIAIGNIGVPFTFTNDMRVASYTISLNINSGAPGQQVNVTIYSGNGTGLAVTLTHTVTYNCGGTWSESCPINSTFLVGTGPLYWQTNASVIVTFLSTETVYVNIQGIDKSPWITDWAKCGGFISVTNTTAYQSAALASGAQAINLQDISYLTNVIQGQYVQDFTVGESSNYLFYLNATNASLANNPPDFRFRVILKGEGVNTMGDDYIVGTGQSVVTYDFTANGPQYYPLVSAYLSAGKTYAILLQPLSSDPGLLTECRWGKITSWAGVVGDAGVAVDFSQSVNYTRLQTGSSTWNMFINFSGNPVQFGTLYDTSLSSPGQSWLVGSQGLFSLTNGWNLVTGGTGAGEFLAVQNTAPTCTINGQPAPILHTKVTMQRIYDSNIWANYTAVPVWETGTISDQDWTHQNLVITVTNHTSPANSLPAVTVKIKADSNGVPQLPGVANTVSPNYFVKNIRFQNDGAADDMGIYKLTGKQGTEFQFQVINDTALTVPAGPSNGFQFQFLTGVKVPDINASNVGTADWGYVLPAAYGGSITFDSTNYTRFTVNGIFECGLLTDTIYVIISSAGAGLDGYSHAATGSNSSNFWMNYTFENFLPNGAAFATGPDNLIQCFSIDVPACGSAQLASLYGESSNTIAGEVSVYPNPFAGCLLQRVTPSASAFNTMLVSGLGAGFSWCCGFHACVVVDTSAGLLANVIPGSVLSLTITACTPPDWLGWILFIATGAAFIATVIYLKRKMKR